MDILGLLIFILFMAFKFLSKMGPDAGPDGTPQRPRRLPPWFPDLEESIPPVIQGPVEKRRSVPVNRVPGDSGTSVEAGQPGTQERGKAAVRKQPETRERGYAAVQKQPEARERGRAAAQKQPVQAAAEFQSVLIQEPAAEDIIKGFVWAEILSPPRAKRPLTADCLRR